MSETKKQKNVKQVNIEPVKGETDNVPTKTTSYEKISLKVISTLLLFISLIGGLFAFSFSENVLGVFLKTSIIFISIFSALALFAIQSLRKNEIIIPNNIIAYSVFLIPLVYVISSIFSDAPFMSLSGYGFETGTVTFLLTMAILVVLISILVRKKTHVLWYQLGLILFGVLVFIAQIANVFFPEISGMSKILGTPLMTFVGNINDFAVFFGAILLLSLSILEFSVLGRIGKIFGSIGLVISILALAFSGFSYLWIVVGLFALVLFVALFSFSTYFAPEAKENKLSYTSLVVVLISAIFVIFGSSVGGLIRTELKINDTQEIYPPTFSDTMPVVIKTMQGGVKETLIGIGPNRFVTKWLKEKPLTSNLFPGWNVDFNFGNSLLLTNIVTVGIVGVLAWIIIFLLLVYTGIKYVFFHPKSGMSGFVTFSSFFVSVYLWITLAIHVPGSGMLTLVFFSTGIFISSLYASGMIHEKKYLFASSPARSFFLVLATVIILIGAVAMDYLAFAKMYASYSYNRATSLAKAGQFAEAKALMSKAISFGESDIYFRGLAETSILELKTRSAEFSSKPNQTQGQVSALMQTASNSLQKAISADPKNYGNYISFASLYQLFVSKDYAETYDYAKTAYKKALEFAPKNPSIYLSIANLEYLKGDTLAAEQNIKMALDLKPNYTQARFQWSQMQIASNDMNGAIKTIEDAIILSPYDAGLRFQLGLLKYEKKQYLQALENFDNVLKYLPEHANARFYLGLSYAKLGRFDEALKELYLIEKSNKGNQTLIDTIADIEREQVPEEIEIDDLPIEEEN